jgi:kumamolisin
LALAATSLILATAPAFAAAQATVRALGGSTPSVVAQDRARLTGEYAPNAVLSINVGLAERDSSQLNEVILGASTPGSPEYGHYLTNAQYMSTFAPTKSQVAAVEAWLRSKRLSVTGVSGDHLLVYARASAAVAERAFGVAIGNYRLGGRAFRATDRDPTVPAGLDIESVSGLSNYNVYQSDTTCTKGKCGFNGNDWRTIYNVTGNGDGQTIGFTLWGRSLPQSDYNEYAKETGTTALALGGAGNDGLEFIHVGGTSTFSETDGEVGLDTESAHAIAPGVHETYWLANTEECTVEGKKTECPVESEENKAVKRRGGIHHQRHL